MLLQKPTLVWVKKKFKKIHLLFCLFWNQSTSELPVWSPVSFGSFVNGPKIIFHTPALAVFLEAHKSVEVVTLSPSHPPSPEALSFSLLHSYTFPTTPLWQPKGAAPTLHRLSAVGSKRGTFASLR